MNQDIRYSGLSAIPSDFDAPDGQLDVAMNLINDDGNLHPILPPAVLSGNFKNTRLLCIHKGVFGTHYICFRPDSKRLFWMDEEFKEQDNANIMTGNDIRDVIAIGNVLSIISDSERSFAIWQFDKYDVLGARPPELYIEFGLYGYIPDSLNDKMTLYFPDCSWHPSGNWVEGDNPYGDNLLGPALANISSYVRSGQFICPFFIRWAFKLYDGSYGWASPPVLLIPNGCTPMYRRSKYGENTDGIAYAEVYPDFAVCSLEWRRLPFDNETMKKWEGIIQGVDFFISPPFYTYDSSKSGFYGHRPLGISQRGTDMLLRGIFKTSKDTDFIPHWTKISDPWMDEDVFHLHSSHNFYQQLKDPVNFHIYASVSFSDLLHSPQWRTPQPDYYDDYDHAEGVLYMNDLTDLVTRPTLNDDIPQQEITPAMQYVYNNRLHLGNLIMTPPLPAPLRTAATAMGSNLQAPGNSKYSIIIYLKKNGKIISRTLDNIYWQEHHCNSNYYWGVDDFKDFPLFYFYPDTDAFAMEIIKENGDRRSFPLHPHGSLKGACYVDDYASSLERIERVDKVYNTYERPSTLYISDPDNPFIFRTGNAMTIPVGQIMALSSAARPVSQGQFGQFPLYIFSDEGIWSAQITAEGIYSSRQPISRDICIAPDNILSLDTSVVFTTKRGIMLLVGSQVECLSDNIKTEHQFLINTLPALSTADIKVCEGLDYGLIYSSQKNSFSDFLSSCDIMYDYVNQRIIAFDSSQLYGYVLSLRSKQWGMMFTNLEESVKSYPDALAIDKQGRLVNFSAHNDFACLPSFLLSRPISLDSADSFKTIRALVQRGHFRRGSVQSILYGSRDGFTWHLVSSSRSHVIDGISGSPYRFFRVALICTLQPDESISGASFDYALRQGFRAR